MAAVAVAEDKSPAGRIVVVAFGAEDTVNPAVLMSVSRMSYTFVAGIVSSGMLMG